MRSPWTTSAFLLVFVLTLANRNPLWAEGDVIGWSLTYSFGAALFLVAGLATVGLPTLRARTSHDLQTALFVMVGILVAMAELLALMDTIAPGQSVGERNEQAYLLVSSLFVFGAALAVTAIQLRASPAVES